MAPRSSREQRRRTHRYTDSNSELISPSGQPYADDSPSASPTKSRPKKAHRRPRPELESETSKSTSNALSSGSLAALDNVNDKLGWSSYDGVRTRDRERKIYEDDEEVRRKLEARERRDRRRREQLQGAEEASRDEERRERRERRRREKAAGEYVALEEPRTRRESTTRRESRTRREPTARRESRTRRESTSRRERTTVEYITVEEPRSRKEHSRHEEPRKRRVISGTYLEQGAPQRSEKDVYEEQYHLNLRGGAASEESDEDYEARRKRRKRWILIGVGLFLLILAIAIPLGIVFANKRSASGSTVGGGSNSTSTSTPSNSNLKGISESDIPKAAQGTVLDPFTWYDTTDFNVTYTDATVGGLSVMGLNTSYDDSKRANDNVPALSGTFNYGTMPVRGVNLGGWLSIEPFITPSLFNGYTTHDNVIDEYTLTSTLGATKAASTLEKHYSSFVNEQTFAEIQAAGFDHVRIPFSYWAVTTYDEDPYVPKISWRYLLRGIEWARKYGLRINLDLHGIPGSQNGWNHSGRQGNIGWLNGTDGTLNGQRSIDIHDQLSTFFAQPRYKSIVTMYGLVNEPKMTVLDVDTVLNWTTNAISTIRGNNLTSVIIFGDGFRGLDNWQGELQGIDNLLLDVHQYVIFNTDQIALNHSDKVNFACKGWTAQALRSEDTSTGFGPTLCGEWSQADTDCASNLNNVGVGSRWEGTLNMVSTPGGSSDGSVLSPTCPTANNPRCSCTDANADPSSWSATYKQWLLDFAEAQMYSFEQGWGWFYWTWKTESASQWSYQDGLAAGVLPEKAYTRTFNCNATIPDYAALGLPEYY